MNTVKSIQVFAIVAAATLFSIGTAYAKPFYYYKKDGTCVNDDTANHSDLNANGNGFYPAGGWGTCPKKMVLKRLPLHLQALKNPTTGDVLGAVKKSN